MYTDGLLTLKISFSLIYRHYLRDKQWVDASLDHYDDVIMATIASQITSLTIVYSAVYSGADQSKHQSSASLAFVGEFTGDRWIPHTNGQ